MLKSIKAFTLVELIVVITILAILGTIAFISLQGYAADARDAKRITETSDLAKKISIKLVDGSYTKASAFATGSTVCDSEFAAVPGTGVNYANLGEPAFRDPTTVSNCTYNYKWGTVIATGASILGGTGTGILQQFQVYTYRETSSGELISAGTWVTGAVENSENGL